MISPVECEGFTKDERSNSAVSGLFRQTAIIVTDITVVATQQFIKLNSVKCSGYILIKFKQYRLVKDRVSHSLYFPIITWIAVVRRSG